MQKYYLCIDLKTFYASVECVERGLDPFNTNLVVADESRGKGTICLAVSPKMKMLGVKNRCRIFEIPPSIKYIVAKPRMKKYIEYSANIYVIYLKYFAKEDIHVYSIDEAFMDVTNYLKMYQMNPVELAKTIINTLSELNNKFNQIENGKYVKLKYYKYGKYSEIKGIVTNIDYIKKKIQINKVENINICDIIDIIVSEEKFN